MPEAQSYKSNRAAPAWLTRSVELIRQGRRFVQATVVGPAGHPLQGMHYLLDPGGIDIALPSGLPPDTLSQWETAVTAVWKNRGAELRTITPGPAAADARDLQVFFACCGPPPEAWIFGGGHIAKALAPLLDALQWRVIVCDDRAEFVTAERFPTAKQRRGELFESSARVCAQRMDDDTWVVLVTRGHAHDESILRCLATAWEQPDDRKPDGFAYIGMIGSNRRVQMIRERLRQEGLPESFLDTLHAPIGLPIGADRPEEIAVSIAAEMIAVRRGSLPENRQESHLSAPAIQPRADTFGSFELWQQVTAAVSTGRPAVLATIVARRGSTPRGPGAQMAVYIDGTTCGTIGGGCGEGTVLRAAKTMLLHDPAPRLLEIDLTGEDARETGDVCGGRYSVFLEVPG